MNKDIYTRLQPFEKYLDEVYKTQSVRGLLRADKRAINEIYGEMGFAPLTQGKMLCDHCIMKMLEDVSKAYFEYKNKYANRKKKNDKNTKEEGTESNSD